MKTIDLFIRYIDQVLLKEKTPSREKVFRNSSEDEIEILTNDIEYITEKVYNFDNKTPKYIVRVYLKEGMDKIMNWYGIFHCLMEEESKGLKTFYSLLESNKDLFPYGEADRFLKYHRIKSKDDK